MNLMMFDQWKSFKDFARPLLEINEVSNNLPLGILLNNKEEDQPIMMGAIIKEGTVLFLFLQTIPQQVIFSKLMDVTDVELKEVAQILLSEKVLIPGIVGERESTLSIAKELGKTINQSMNQRLYKLEKVKKRPSEKGYLRRVEREEKVLVKEWVFQFCLDIHDPISKEEAEEKAIKHDR